jgi:tetratricopeptide (TPR) repeat protein
MRPIPSPRRACFRAGLLPLVILAVAWPVAVLAQDNDDTRLRLNQTVERKAADREADLLKDAQDGAAVPSTLVIDGRTYAVGATVSEMGEALYVSVARRQWPDARRFLKAYLALPGHDPMLVLYAQGMLARQGGDLPGAERAFRALLALQPDFLPGQVELARVLFENQQDRDALRAFEAIKAALPKDDARAAGVGRTVDSFIAALKHRRSWQGSIAAGPSYNSNINQSSGAYTCLLPGPGGLCFFDRKAPDPIGAGGVNFEATASRRLPWRGHSGLLARALLYGDVYPDDNRYSQATLTTQLGYDYRTARYGYALSPSLDLGAFGSNLLYDAWGVHAEGTYNLSSATALKLEGDRKTLRYRQADFAALTGGMTSVFATVWHVFPGQWTASGGFDFTDKAADDPVNAYQQTGLRLGLGRPLGKGFNAYLFASLRHRDYGAWSALLAARRRDDEQNIVSILKMPKFRFAGAVPSLTLQYNRVNSNVDWLYSYRKVAVSLKLERAF